MVGVIAVLLIASVTSLVVLSNRMFVEDNTALIQQMNADTASSLASQTREYLDGVTEKMRILGVYMRVNPGDSVVVQEFFMKDKDLLAVIGQAEDVAGAFQPFFRAVAPQVAEAGDPQAEALLANFQASSELSLAPVAQGETRIGVVRLGDGSLVLALSIPFVEKGEASGTFSHLLTAFVRQARFLRVFGESAILTTYLVDANGRLLVHSDAARAAAAESVADLGIVRRMLEGKFNNEQTRYVDARSSEPRLAAYRLLGFAGLGVVAEVAEAKAFETSKKIEFRSILISLIVLSASFFLGYMVSRSITRPIQSLVIAARRIAAGDFKIQLKPSTRDEVATLSLAFNDMARGLEERDRVKETFNKFHNKEIAEKLLSGEVKLGGERREAVVFFSDVRGFTSLSESLEPERVVELLNEYMTRMVAIIREHGGVVDKYVGDAIMALWGVPLAREGDVENSVRACLAMRAELAQLNALRESRGEPPLKIGMGLNLGPVIAGNIGSDEKMEYTVIGDSVNLASRVESLTKEYGTDLLVSKSIQERLGERFVFEACKTAKVKGKAQAIEIFRVRGYIDESGQPILVQTPYSEYAPEKSDKSVHDDTSSLIFDKTSFLKRPEPEQRAAPAPEPLPLAEPSLAEAPLHPDDPPDASEPSLLMPAPESQDSAAPAIAIEGLPIEVPGASIEAEPAPRDEPALDTPAQKAPRASWLTSLLGGATQAPPSKPTAISVPPPFKAPPPAAASSGGEATEPELPDMNWFINLDGPILGPFSTAELWNSLQSGSIPLNCTVSESKTGPWTPLRETPILSELANRAA